MIDPLNAYLGSQIDSDKDASVQQILSPLAQETNAAIVGIRHWGKGAQGKAIHRGLGSTGYTAAARSVLQFALDPDDPASGRVVIAVAKSNLSRFPESVVFRIQQHRINVPNGGIIQTSRIEWLGHSSHTADDQQLARVGLAAPSEHSSFVQRSVGVGVACRYNAMGEHEQKREVLNPNGDETASRGYRWNCYLLGGSREQLSCGKADRHRMPHSAPIREQGTTRICTRANILSTELSIRASRRMSPACVCSPTTGRSIG